MTIIKKTIPFVSFTLLFFLSGSTFSHGGGFGGFHGGGFHGGSMGGFGGGGASRSGGMGGFSGGGGNFRGFQGGGMRAGGMPMMPRGGGAGFAPSPSRFMGTNSFNHPHFNSGHYGRAYSGRSMAGMHQGMRGLSSSQNFHRYHENYGVGRAFSNNRRMGAYPNAATSAVRGFHNPNSLRALNSRATGLGGFNRSHLAGLGRPSAFANRSLGFNSRGLNSWGRGAMPGLWGGGLGAAGWSHGNWGWNHNNWNRWANWNGNPNWNNNWSYNTWNNNNWYWRGGWGYGCGWGWGWGCNQWRWGWNAPFYPIYMNYYHFYGYPLYPYSYFPYYYGYPFFGYGVYFSNVYVVGNDADYDSGYLAAPVLVQQEKIATRWIKSSNGKVPKNAVVSDNKNDKTTYYCRASYKHQLYKGVLVAKDGCYCMPNNGVTIRFNNYQVLVRA